MRRFLNHLIKDCTAATAIEYGLIAAFVAIAAIFSMNALGSALSAKFRTASAQMSSYGGADTTAGDTSL